MAYTRPKTFADDDPSTPINASALHAMQDAVYSQAVADAATATNTAVTNAELGPNVQRDFGAIGDGVTDDRGAFQNAINILNITGGGSLFIPVGNYKIGSPGIVWPQNTQVSISLVGQSPGGAATTSRPTRLFRTGAYPLITAIGTAATISTTVNDTLVHGMNLQDLFLDGANQAAHTVDLQYTANSFWTRVTVKDSNRCGLRAMGLWNDHFTDCYFTGNGDQATSTPSILISDPGVAGPGAGTNSAHFTSCEHEGNKWDDVQITGQANPSVGVMFTANKHERAAGAGIRVLSSNGVSILGGYFFMTANNAGVIVNGGNLVSIMGNTFGGSSASNPTNCVHLAGGAYCTVVGNTFLGGLNHVRLDAGFGEATVGLNVGNQFNSPVNVSDARTTKTGTILGRGTLQQSGGIGVYGATPPAARPVVTGSRGGNAAVASLVSQLATLGLVTDFTSA